MDNKENRLNNYKKEERQQETKCNALSNYNFQKVKEQSNADSSSTCFDNGKAWLESLETFFNEEMATIKASENNMREFETFKKPVDKRGDNLNVDDLKLYLENVMDLEKRIAEKMITATNTSYRDDKDISTSLNQLKDFEHELKANEERVNGVIKSGENLIEKCPRHAVEIEPKIESLKEQWSDLMRTATEKCNAMEDANRKIIFDETTKSMLSWITEISSQIITTEETTDEIGLVEINEKMKDLEDKDKQLAHKRKMLNDIADHAVKLKEQYPDRGDEFEEIQEEVRIKLKQVEAWLADRRDKLLQQKKVQQFLRDLQNENEWFNDKINNNKLSPETLQVCLQKIRRLKSLATEIDNHGARIDDIKTAKIIDIQTSKNTTDQLEQTNKDIRIIVSWIEKNLEFLSTFELTGDIDQFNVTKHQFDCINDQMKIHSKKIKMINELIFTSRNAINKTWNDLVEITKLKEFKLSLAPTNGPFDTACTKICLWIEDKMKLFKWTGELPTVEVNRQFHQRIKSLQLGIQNVDKMVTHRNKELNFNRQYKTTLRKQEIQDKITTVNKRWGELKIMLQDGNEIFNSSGELPAYLRDVNSFIDWRNKKFKMNTETIMYVCGDCRQDVPLGPQYVIVCSHCGCKILFKKATNRLRVFDGR